MTDFDLALSDVCRAWPALMPPTRRRVSESAADFLVIKRPGGASGNWSPDETPYMVKPTDMLASRVHSAVCFVGPAQTGKTVSLGEGWMTHAVISDPGDMLIVQMTQDKAREYSRQRIDRALRHSPALKAMKSGAARDDNLHDKAFRNGMMLRIGWPTATNLSSTSYRYVFGTDYDRWDDDIEGEGDGFTLMGKRIATFLSRGMVAVESSPGRPCIDPNWTPRTPHEAPPVKGTGGGAGILGIYNRGDRQRWFWQCPECREYHEAEPGLRLFGLPSDDELLEDVRTLDIPKFAKQHARVICPNNGCVIKAAHKAAMNRGGVWLEEGLTIDEHGRISGTPRTSSIASFWLGGVAAAYVSWETLVLKHAQALLEYAMTGSELPLQTTVNTDQGMPYMARHLVEATRKVADPRTRAEDFAQHVVPDAARFLVAVVDVQGGRQARFVVHVFGVGEWKEWWLVDRYSIKRSTRDGFDGEHAPIDPASYPEDWDLLTTKVVKATYRTSMEGAELRVHQVFVDSGGEDGVTDKAYAWWRRLKRDGLHDRVRLTKGHNTRVDWHIRETFVGGKHGNGDIPLLLLEPNKFKDMVDAGLKRTAAGPGYYHFPKWLPDAFYDELKAEVRNETGVWEHIRGANEAFDAAYGAHAAVMFLGADKRDFWHAPPKWALPLNAGNSGVITSEERRKAAATTPLSTATQWERRSRPSSYLHG